MPAVPEHIIDRIRDSVDIVELISRYINLRKQGKNYKSLCPFHPEKTPSFSVSPDKQIFYCFGCGAGGNVFNFLMRFEKITFPEAFQKLAAEAGIELPKYQKDEEKSSEYDRLYRTNQFAAEFYHQQLNDDEIRISKYLEKRQISQETISFFKLGYIPEAWDLLFQEINQKKMKIDPFIKTGLILQSEKDTKKKYDRFRNRLIFPIHNLSGRVVAFGGRSLSDEPNTPKYLNSPESPIYNKSQILYGLYYAKDWIRQEDLAIFVEGYMDYLQLFQNDIKNVVATSGTALTEDHARIIRRYTKNIVLCYDADSAGIQAAIRGGQNLFQENLDIRVLILPENEDPDSYVRKNGKSAFFSLLNEAPDYFDFKISQLQKLHGSEGISQKAKIVEELIDSIVAHKDPLKQNFYANLVAQQFNIQENTLVEQIQKKQKIFRSRKRKDVQREQKTVTEEASPLHLTGAWSAEKDVLILLLNHFEEVKNIIFKLLEDDDFQNAPFKNVFSLIRDNVEREKQDLVHWLFSSLDDENVIGLLSAELFHDIEQPDRYLNDCIQKIKITRYQRQIDDLRQKLRQLKPDDPEYNTILQTMNECLIKIKEFRKIFNQ
ncbi:MAG: DNA primase [Calditrichae bacterium]|nr:DNA primase [Calditrichia bacterium]